MLAMIKFKTFSPYKSCVSYSGDYNSIIFSLGFANLKIAVLKFNLFRKITVALLRKGKVYDLGHFA